MKQRMEKRQEEDFGRSEGRLVQALAPLCHLLPPAELRPANRRRILSEMRQLGLEIEATEEDLADQPLSDIQPCEHQQALQRLCDQVRQRSLLRRRISLPLPMAALLASALLGALGWLAWLLAPPPQGEPAAGQPALAMGAAAPLILGSDPVIFGLGELGSLDLATEPFEGARPLGKIEGDRLLLEVGDEVTIAIAPVQAPTGSQTVWIRRNP
jgi:hypothetical protein